MLDRTESNLISHERQKATRKIEKGGVDKKPERCVNLTVKRIIGLYKTISLSISREIQADSVSHG